MTKGKKRGSRIGPNQEGNGPNVVDARRLRVRKRHENTNVRSEQHDQLDNVQIHQHSQSTHQTGIRNEAQTEAEFQHARTHGSSSPRSQHDGLESHQQDHIDFEMTKGKKRGSRIGSNQKGNGPIVVNGRSLRVRKRLENTNMPSEQHDQLDNVQIHQHDGLESHQQDRIGKFARSLRAQKELEKTNVPSKQHDQDNVQIHQHSHSTQHTGIRNEAQTELEFQHSRSHVSSSPRSQHVGLESHQQDHIDCGSVTRKRKGRGSAYYPARWNSGARLNVTLNARGLIVGEHYQELATAIGILAKVGSAFSIACERWSQIPKENKEDVWKKVEENTFLPSEAQSSVYEMLNVSWKEWKHRVKNHYKKYQHNEEEMFEKLDERVDLDQFRAAILHWKKPEVQEQARTNAANRGQRKFPHRTGRTSFSQIDDELTLRGEPTTQLDIWMTSRSKGKGVKEDNETSDLYEFIMGAMNEVSTEERTDEFREKLYQDVVCKERPRRATCVGRNIYKMSRGSNSGICQTTRERMELREELNKIKEEREELCRFKEEMKLEREREKYEMDLKFKQVNDLIALYGSPQSAPGIASCSLNFTSQELDATSTGRHASGLLDGVKVDLFCMEVPKVVVAEGILVSKDPEDKVNNLPLGQNYWKVFVEKVNQPSYKMFRSITNVLTVGQAIRKFVPWPKSNVLEKNGDVVSL